MFHAPDNGTRGTRLAIITPPVGKALRGVLNPAGMNVERSTDAFGPSTLFAAIGLAAALVLPGQEASALWARMSEAELVRTSPLIVVGTLDEIARIPTAGAGGDDSDGGARTVSVIRIERVLKGDPAAGLALIALPDPDAPVSSSDLSYAPGQSGLWFLRAAGPGGRPASGALLFAADHPQRFVAADQAAAMIDAVRQRLGR